MIEGHNYTLRIAQAYAVLFAAAPKLLAACQALAAIEDVADVIRARDMAKAAIATATPATTDDTEGDPNA